MKEALRVPVPNSGAPPLVSSGSPAPAPLPLTWSNARGVLLSAASASQLQLSWAFQEVDQALPAML